MKKRLWRKITVGGIVYQWKIGKVNADGDGNCFLEIRYGRIFYSKEVRQDITPAFVREQIEKYYAI